MLQGQSLRIKSLSNRKKPSSVILTRIFTSIGVATGGGGTTPPPAIRAGTGLRFSQNRCVIGVGVDVF